MSAKRTVKSASILVERYYIFGLGLLLGAIIVGDGESIKDSIVALVGACLVVGSTIANVVIRRRQIKKNRTENLKVLK